MVTIPKEAVDSYRLQTFRIDPSLQLHTQEDAIDFVNERGFIFFLANQEYNVSEFMGGKSGQSTSGRQSR